jgi:hypothetical protein
MDKELLALLGNKEAFGEKIAELLRATALMESAQEAAQKIQAEADARLKKATAAESRLAGNEQNHREALEKYKANEASFKATVAATKAELEKREGAVMRRENSVKAAENAVAHREKEITAKEQRAQAREDQAKATIADLDARRKRAHEAFA